MIRSGTRQADRVGRPIASEYLREDAANVAPFLRRLKYGNDDEKRSYTKIVEAIRRGGNIPCAMNAANEAAVKAYLEDRIGFYDIPEIIGKTMAETPFIGVPSLEDIFATNEAAYAVAEEKIARK